MVHILDHLSYGITLITISLSEMPSKGAEEIYILYASTIHKLK
jgi:hypothetical protein